ncbi:MAG: Gldg family protein [Armatimonadota bacterium]|nr:Gldg family protein [Armatimonadota bacterium]
MSDETTQQEPERARRPLADPRLAVEAEQLSPVEQVAMWAGWLAALGLLVLLAIVAVTTSFGLTAKIVAGVTVALAVFFVLMHWQRVVAAAGTRRARLGTNSVVFVLFILGALVLVNVIVARRPHLRKDLTESQRFSLAEQSEEIVRGLEEEVTVLAFLDPRSPTYGETRNRLREYNMLSPKLSVEHHDFYLDVEEVKEHNIMQPGTIVVKSGENEEKVYDGSEEDLTSAILAVSTGEKTNIYFLIGHGEVNPDDTGPDGIRTLKGELEAQQYAVKTLNLLVESEPEIPGDCAVLVIAGPTQPLRDAEMQAITSWAEQGGNLLVALEPGGPDLSELLEPWGIVPKSGAVADARYGIYGRKEVPMVTNLGSHQITKPLGRFAIALPTVRPLELIDTMPEDPSTPGAPPQGKQAQLLLESSPEASLEPAGEGSAAGGGPFVLAAAVDAGRQPPNPYGMQPPEEDEDALRMVVVGDGEFMTDRYLREHGLIGNLVFALASINWLVENEKLISIPPKDEMPDLLTMNESQQKVVWVITVGIVPILIGIAGFAVWWRRR